MSRPGPVELNFVSIGTPTDAKSQDFRKRVRSHVSKRQHQRAREERRTRALERREHLNAAGRVAIEPGPVEPPRLRETEQTDESQVVASIELSRTARNPMDRSFAHGTAAFSTFVLDDADNVIGKALNAFGFDTLGVVVRTLLLCFPTTGRKTTGKQMADRVLSYDRHSTINSS